MLEKVLSSENINAALEYLQTKKDSSGIDGLRLSQLPEYLTLNQQELFDRIRNGTYEPQVVVLFQTVNRKGKQRTLAKFASLDRLLLRAMFQVLEPLIKPTFSPYSFAVSGGGTLAAVRCAADYVQQGNTWVVELDLKSYFDQISHEKILELLHEYIEDIPLLNLIQQYLRQKISCDYQITRWDCGILQGNALSPILANLYLDSFDQFCMEQGMYFIRYMDDIKVFTPSYEKGCQILEQTKQYLEHYMSLELSSKKTGVFSVQNRPILGYRLNFIADTIEIRISYLHAASRRSQSLNLDISEIFKPLITDRCIFTLINKHMISEIKHFEEESNGGIYLTKEGKRIFISQFEQKLQQTISVNEKRYTYLQLIREELYKLVRFF